MSAELISITPNYMELLKTACRQPYGNDVNEKGVKAIIESGHLSVLEHCYASFLVKCSVRVLGQLTRHRHLSFDIVVIPDGMIAFAKQHGVSQETIDSMVDKNPMLHAYKDCIKDGLKEQDAAYFLPQGVETSLVVTGNFRVWYEYLPKRLCRRAMPEHRKLAEDIHKLLADAAPEIFDRCMLNCDNCKERSCSF